TRPALLLGSLPPAGRDYDILLHDVDRCAVEAALRSNGFMCIDRRFVRLAADRADVVDLLTVGDLCLPESEIEELFERTQPLSGHARIGVPAPAHQVLLLARKLPRTPGLLEDHHLQRL